MTVYKLSFVFQQEKEMLEEMLLKSQENLEESRSYINILQAKQKDEQKARAR